MEILFVLVPLTILIAFGFVALFISSVNKGQFEELESPASRMLFEDEKTDKGKVVNKK
ncbi:MAG: cbb3-type cytochrome oxidase assembly protein CcoS [Bacteriovoracaceae bacterium]